jgi:YesN/AraC family two-component response regulator
MPVMDGIELSKQIYEQKSKRIIMILLSAYNEFSYAQQAIKYGVKEYLLKPSNFTELKEVFEKVRLELDEIYDNTTVTVDHERDIINQVYQYCAENYKEGSLVELADLLYLNSSYLSQLIRQKTDKTFSDIMNENRMQQAVALLENSDVKIYTIGHMVGYMNPNNFTRAFRNHFGIAPTEYRINKGKQP